MHVYNKRAREAESSRYDAAAVENGDIILDDAAESEQRFPLTWPPLADAFRRRALLATDVHPLIVDRYCNKRFAARYWKRDSRAHAT